MLIKLQNLSKTYNHKDVLSNINIEINSNEIVGILGANGAGKTTLMRILMGYIKPTNGTCSINNQHCFNDATTLSKTIGYIPGEISFSHNCTAIDYLNFIASLKNITDKTNMLNLIHYFQLDTSLTIKEMSKGTKQKLAIILCFMHDPKIYLLDEPTSGLDPIMQQKFIEYILLEKQKGKTIFLASHQFEEIEKTCDRILLLKDGQIKYNNTVKSIRTHYKNTYEITFNKIEELKEFIKHKDVTIQHLTITYQCNCLNDLIKQLSHYDIISLNTKPFQIEQLFNFTYKGDNK